MKRTPVLLAAGLTGIMLAACGATSGTSTSATPSAAAPPSAAPDGTSQAHNAADVTFAQDMIPHHRQAVMMAQLASSRAKRPAVKALAARIEAAQDPEITTMTGWLTGWGQPTGQPGMNMAGPGSRGTGSMSGMMSDADMTKLSGLNGAGFDREFLTMMTAHHQGAIEMARTQLAQGQYQPAKVLARNIITNQTAEIDTMRTLLTEV